MNLLVYFIAIVCALIAGVKGAETIPANRSKSASVDNIPPPSAIQSKFQQALMEEELNQNLDAAIASYREVVANLDAQRKMAATALFRLGECYRKQGHTNEALAQYDRILRDFTDQAQVVEMAQRQSFALNPSKKIQNLASASNASDHQPLNPNQVPLVREEIKLIEQQLVEITRRLENGKAETKDTVKPRQEILSLQMLLPENADPEKQKSLIEKQIALEESLLAETRKKIEVGAAAPIDVVPYERNILNWKRELAAVSQMPATSAIPAEQAPTEEEAKEVQRIKAIIRDSPDLINARDKDGMTPLHYAASKGQLVVARFLLDNHAEVNAQGVRGYTALHQAVQNGHKSMVELLLKAGADVNMAGIDKRTPLFLAALNGYRSIAEVLLAAHANVNPTGIYFDHGTKVVDFTPLHAAIYKEFQTMAELLLDHGADIEAQSHLSPGGPPQPQDAYDGTVLHYAAAAGRESLVDLLLSRKARVDARNDQGQTPLWLAARKNHTGASKLLAEHGADVNGSPSANDYSVLCWVALNNNLELAKFLLAHQANPNWKGHNGVTALILLGDKANAGEMISLLLSHGADINAQTENGRETALVYAINANLTNNVQVLLAGMPNLEIQNINGMTPLQLAVSRRNAVITDMLLKAGANPKVTSNTGDTPLHWAVANGDKEIVQLLLEHGAQANVQNKNGNTPLQLVPSRTRQNLPMPLPIPAGPLPGLRPVPNRQPTPPNSSPAPEELVTLLKKYGANENLERLTRITLSRPSMDMNEALFLKGTNANNRFTLLDAFVQRSIAFPDLAHITIHRLSNSGKTNTLKVSVDEAMDVTNQATNIWLEWGDIIEIPVKDHLVDEPWSGYSEQFKRLLTRGLKREVTYNVKGQTNHILIVPRFINRSAFTEVFDTRAPSQRLSSLGWAPDSVPSVQILFRLNQITRNAKVLLTSSDTTRVHVQRIDPITHESLDMEFNLDNTDPNTDLWLLDGDVINIPDRDE